MNSNPRNQLSRKLRRQNGNNRQVKSVKPLTYLHKPLTVPAYMGEQFLTMKLPQATQLLATGLAASFQLVQGLGDLGLTARNFTDFQNMWDQYVVLSAKVHIWPVTPVTPGLAIFFFDSSANPNLPVLTDDARDGVRKLQHSANSSTKYWMNFTVTDPFLLSWRNTTVNYIFGYFKAITDTPNFGTTAVSTLLYNYNVEYTVRFRGRKV